MYKCSECHKEFSEKPDFCDCGNDTFEQSFEPKPKKKNISFFNKYNLSPFALLFFTACTILSLVVLFFPVSSESKKPQTQPEKKILHKETKFIPDIDKIWDNTPKTVLPQQSKTADMEPVQKPLVPSIFKPKAQDSSQQKPRSKVSKTTAKPAPKKPQKTQNIKKPETQPQKTAPKKTFDSELFNYKVGLRNALFSNLFVPSVAGRGRCGIEFKIDKNGKLTNRAFTYQSPNASVNDAVYKMMMRLPQYYPPPSGYKGELIKMTFEFDNGTYSINYVN